MPLVRGTRLGPYEIEELVGAGGMGEVYRAHDTRLARVVAIKVLADASAANAALRERFDSEAHAIAALSHPHICTLYDVGHHEGIDFLVMEFLSGQTLASRLVEKGPLPVLETLTLSTQLAEALAAAHRGGVLHRDLKPANVMLTAQGVKVLDFGLAKLQPMPAPALLQLTTRAASPLTDSGIVMGTVPYMSPEQLEGRHVDARSDIFALGAVIYEMIAGTRAFPGQSAASVIAAILEREPPAIAHYDTPAAKRIERVARKSLAKQPDARWQSASDIADELRWIATEQSSNRAAATDGVRARRAIVVAVSVAVAAVAVAWVWRSAEPRSELVAPPRFSQATFDGNVRIASLSPDGRTVAYVSGSEPDLRVLVHDLDSGSPLEIWKSAVIYDLRWLPNGTQLVASGAGGTWLLPRFGGPPQRLSTRLPAFVASSSDAKRFAQAWFAKSGFRILALNEPSETEIPLKGYLWLAGLDWNAANNRVLLLTTDADENAIVWSTRPDGSDVQRAYSDPLFVRSMCSDPGTGTIYLFRPRRGEEELIRIRPGPSTTKPEVLLRVSPTSADPSVCTVSADGRRLLYVGESGHANLWRLDLQTPDAAAIPLTRGTAWLTHPAVTPDGQSIIVSQGRDSDGHLLKLPMSGGAAVPLTAGASASISSDGQRLAYVIRVPGRGYRVWTSDADGRGAAELTDASTNGTVRPRWLPDGRLAWQSANGRDYRIRDLTTGREEWLIGNDIGYAFYPHFSPNRDLIAFYWSEPGPSPADTGLWLVAWPGRQRRFLAAGMRPLGWSANGDSVYASGVGAQQLRTIFKVSVATGATEMVGSFPRGYFSSDDCSQTIDRQSLICALTESSRDAWIVDRFDRH